MRVLLIAGDLAANVLFGALGGVAALGLIATGWNMFLAMLLAMALGMLVGMVGAILLTPILGAMEVMLPLMLSGMVAGMAVGMMEAMHAMTLWQSIEIGALLGVAGFTFCQLADYLLRGESTSWTR